MLLAVKSEKKLEKIKKELAELGVVTYNFIEPDRNNEVTAMATELISEDKKYIFKRFMLL